MPLLHGQHVLAVDTETTGLIPGDGHALVEVAVVPIDDGTPGEGWSSLVNPGRPIPHDAAAVHGITDEMVANAPDQESVGAELRRRCGTATLVFHNASFDLPFIAALLRKAGVEPLRNPVIDTLGLARGLNEPGGNSLGALAARLRLPSETKHRALGDARTTASLLVKLTDRWEKEGRASTLDELAAVSQDMIRLSQAR